MSQTGSEGPSWSSQRRSRRASAAQRDLLELLRRLDWQDLVLEQVLAAQALIMTELNLKSTNTAKKQVESPVYTETEVDSLGVWFADDNASIGVKGADNIIMGENISIMHNGADNITMKDAQARRQEATPDFLANLIRKVPKPVVQYVDKQVPVSVTNPPQAAQP